MYYQLTNNLGKNICRLFKKYSNLKIFNKKIHSHDQFAMNPPPPPSTMLGKVDFENIRPKDQHCTVGKGEKFENLRSLQIFFQDCNRTFDEIKNLRNKRNQAEIDGHIKTSLLSWQRFNWSIVQQFLISNIPNNRLKGIAGSCFKIRAFNFAIKLTVNNFRKTVSSHLKLYHL